MKVALIFTACWLGLSSGQQAGKDGKSVGTFGWFGDIIFGANSCRNSRCRNDYSRAQNCCYNHRKCCQYVDNNGNNGYYPGNNGFNPGFGGQKPGRCPNNGNGFGNGFGSGIGSANSGRKRRSPEQAPKSSSGGFFGGGGYSPGYNSCYNDSNCPGRQKCCYTYNGQTCVNPSIFG